MSIMPQINPQQENTKRLHIILHAYGERGRGPVNGESFNSF